MVTKFDLICQVENLMLIKVDLICQVENVMLIKVDLICQAENVNNRESGWPEMHTSAVHGHCEL